MKDVIIIGGGMSGMTAGYLLKKQGLEVQILEANDCLGGRIKTVTTSTGAALELGATWVFHDPNLRALLNELEIGLYDQYNKGYALYETTAQKKAEYFSASQMTGGQTYHKVVGGTYQIIDVLAAQIGSRNILTNTIVKTIEDKDDFISVISENGKEFKAKNVIVTIPPRLLEATLSFVPDFFVTENSIRKNTHTWMGESAKFSVEYRTPFWRKKDLAGLAISTVGLLREVQDHVNATNSAFSLVGFLNLSEDQMNWTKLKRKEYVIKDLVRIFGKEAKDVLCYEDYIWSRNPFTVIKDMGNKGLYPHQNNGNKEIIKNQMNNKLFFAGAETSADSPGYMEGAVKSAKKVMQIIMEKSA